MPACSAARRDESSRWIDFDFYGHQITAHLAEKHGADAGSKPVDGDRVPVRISV
jgi:uncharacterized protein